uniref:Uncharacterized protein n=1 Tax=Amphimedon queenslandica TaxID=400682 RepID=A0A1X7V469_AMPQE
MLLNISSSFLSQHQKGYQWGTGYDKTGRQ